MVATAQTSATICGKPLGLATAHTSALIGLETQPIAVEVCATRGPSMFQLVGLAHAAVREARVRVASALAGIGVLMDEHAITVNLAPADLRKSGRYRQMPSSIRRSRFGLSTCGKPAAFTVSCRCWSVMMKTMFGRLEPAIVLFMRSS